MCPTKHLSRIEIQQRESTTIDIGKVFGQTWPRNSISSGAKNDPAIRLLDEIVPSINPAVIAIHSTKRSVVSALEISKT